MQNNEFESSEGVRIVKILPVFDGFKPEMLHNRYQV